jgi:hypothetical protein
MKRFYGCVLLGLTRLRLVPLDKPRGDFVLTSAQVRERRERQKSVRRLRAIVVRAEGRRWKGRTWRYF